MTVRELHDHVSFPKDREHHRTHPIYYSKEEMQKPKEELIAKLRSDLADLRGKLFDIRMGYGWEDRIDTAEHGITLVISYLYGVLEEMEKTNEHHRKNEEIRRAANTMPPGGV